MKRVLIVSYFYPPIYAVGSVRIASFVRHLPKLGWQPYVVTARPGRWVSSSGKVPGGEDPSLVCRTPCVDVNRIILRMLGNAFRDGGVTRSRAAKEKGIPILQSGIFFYDNLFAFPDSTWPWYFIGAREAIRFASRVKPDLILSSSAPFTSHLLAARISKAIGVPWVADFRDPWSGNVNVTLSAFSRWARERLERRVVRSASAISTVSEPFAEGLRALHNKNVYVVTNGFEPSPPVNDIMPLDRFTVLFTGMIYPGRLDPSLLFAAVRSLREEGRAPKGMRIVFYGPNHDITRRMAIEAGVDDFVECNGVIPLAQALGLQARAHLLLVLDFNNPKSSGVFPGKFFEYLGAGRPMLAISSKGGSMDNVMQATGTGRVASSVEEIKETIVSIYHRYARGEPLLPDRKPDEIAKYTRENQARVLAGHLSSLLKPE